MEVLDDRKKDPRVGRAECIRGKCFDCTAGFADGRYDCEHFDCPAYVRMPYRRGVPRISWMLGAWSSKYRNRCEAHGMSIVEYVQTFMIRNGRIIIPTPDIMRAKCFRCCADYRQGNEKGRVDCGVVGCPYYFYTPYRTERPNYDWLFDSGHTRKHVNKKILLGISREEYVEQFFGKNAEEDDEEVDDSTDSQ